MATNRLPTTLLSLVNGLPLPASQRIVVLVPTKILHQHLNRQPVGGTLHLTDENPRRLGLEKLRRPLHRGVHLLGQRLYAQFVAVVLQHSLEHKVPSNKHMTVHPLAFFPIKRRHRLFTYRAPKWKIS